MIPNNARHVKNSAFRDWLVVDTLPIWLKQGYDQIYGGFHEKLDLNLRPITAEGKRIMVQARQCYVFSSLGLLLPNGAAVAKGGFDFIISYGRSPDGGWRHRVARDGKAIDNSRDLYDQAFVIFAAACMTKAFSSVEARYIADETLAYLDSDRIHPAGGYTEIVLSNGQLAEGPRRQNPHMHLLEALLTLYDVTGDDQYIERAEQIVQLALEKFIVDDTLREYFTDSLDPLPGNAGKVVEPGHHMEWVWLLHRYVNKTNDKLAINAASRLYNFAITHGYDRSTCGLYDKVFFDGTLKCETRRLWPQTEALKAHLAFFEHGGDQIAISRINNGIKYLLGNHLKSIPGGWREHLDPESFNLYNSFPASSLYHLSSAVNEIDRLKGEIDEGRS